MFEMEIVILYYYCNAELLGKIILNSFLIFFILIYEFLS